MSLPRLAGKSVVSFQSFRSLVYASRFVKDGCMFEVRGGLPADGYYLIKPNSSFGNPKFVKKEVVAKRVGNRDGSRTRKFKKRVFEVKHDGSLVFRGTVFECWTGLFKGLAEAGLLKLSWAPLG